LIETCSRFQRYEDKETDLRKRPNF